MEVRLYLLLTIATVMYIETTAVRFPDDSTTCQFIRWVNARCNISIPKGDELLFMESRLQEAVKQCDVSDPTRLRNLRVDVLTYVAMTSRCGVIFTDPEKIPTNVTVEVLSKLLSWPSGIPTMNCMQVRRILQYVAKYLIRFYNDLDRILALLKGLSTENLAHILAVLPGQLCTLGASTGIQIYDPSQVPNLVDALANNCHSRTILSSEVTCSWKDSPNPAVVAMAQSRAESGGGDGPCIPVGAGARCLIASPCVKFLCLLDIRQRGCDSPCPKPARLSCTRNSTEKCLGTRAQAMSVTLPDPDQATAESLQDYVCCLLRYPRKELKYSDEVLCNLQPPKDRRCLQAFTRRQITHAPKCLNCTTSSHFAALLSPKCRQEAVKMYPTTIPEVKALITAMTARRNVLLQLFNHLYKSLDLPLVQIICIKPFMRAVTVENIKKLGIDQLEDVLEAMAMCEEPPAPAKVLAVLVKGESCPLFILKREGRDLVRTGAITDKCLESMSVDEALEVCSILMIDKAPKIPRSKIQLMCKILDNSDKETTCIFCSGRAQVQSSNSKAVSANVRVERCLRLRLLTRTSLTPTQREEIKLCKPCMDGSDNTTTGSNPTTMDADGDPTSPWCDEDFQISGIEEIQTVLGNLCEISDMVPEDGSNGCSQIKCFIQKAAEFYKNYLQEMQDSDTETDYSLLRYLRLFMSDSDRTQLPARFQWLRCIRMCPFVEKAYKDFLSSTAARRGKRDACYAVDVIEGFTDLGDGGTLTNVIEADELNCLDPEEARDIIRTRNLHMEDWTSAQARVLLNKVLRALGRDTIDELTVDDLRELGLILIALTPEEIGRLQDMDSTTFAVCGSSTLWTNEQHRALIEKYLRQEGRTPSQLTEDDLFILQNLVNGFTKEEAMELPTDAVRGASAVLGEVRFCDLHLVAAFTHHLRQAHGDPGTWDESQVAEFSYLLGALTSQEWNAQGITILAHVPDHVWRYHVTQSKYNELESHLREAITERQLALIEETGECSAENDPYIPTTVSGGSTGHGGLWVLLVCALLVGLTSY